MLKRTMLIGSVLVLLSGSFTVGALAGIVWGERSVYHRQFLQEQDAIAPILGDGAFRNLTVHEYSGGGAYLDQLRANLVRLFYLARIASKDF